MFASMSGSLVPTHTNDAPRYPTARMQHQTADVPTSPAGWDCYWPSPDAPPKGYVTCSQARQLHQLEAHENHTQPTATPRAKRDTETQCHRHAPAVSLVTRRRRRLRMVPAHWQRHIRPFGLEIMDQVGSHVDKVDGRSRGVTQFQQVPCATLRRNGLAVTQSESCLAALTLVVTESTRHAVWQGWKLAVTE